MKKARLIIIITISLLASAVILLLVQYFLLLAELKNIQSQLVVQEGSQKAAFFANLFINKVLISTGTVDFESRLQLENAVRDLNDPEIFSQWQKFTSGSGGAETQKTAGNILKLLINKMHPQTPLDISVNIE